MRSFVFGFLVLFALLFGVKDAKAGTFFFQQGVAAPTNGVFLAPGCGVGVPAQTTFFSNRGFGGNQVFLQNGGVPVGGVGGSTTFFQSGGLFRRQTFFQQNGGPVGGQQLFFRGRR